MENFFFCAVQDHLLIRLFRILGQQFLHGFTNVAENFNQINNVFNSNVVKRSSKKRIKDQKKLPRLSNLFHIQKRISSLLDSNYAINWNVLYILVFQK